MEEKRMSVREWQQAYQRGEFQSPNLAVQVRAGWYDWFCSDAALKHRLDKLAKLVMGIRDPFILDNYYVWFKNNCPLQGPLYDDVRFEPLGGERNGKYFVVSLDCPYEQEKWTLYTERHGFEEPEFSAATVREMRVYLNRLGPDLQMLEGPVQGPEMTM